MKDKIKLNCVIFDLDGVLVDTEYFQWYGWVKVLKQFKINLDKDKYISEYAGKTGTIIESELIKDYSLSIERGSLLEQKEKLLIELLKSKKIKLISYARGAVDFFSNKNIKLAVVSGSPREEVILKLQRSELLNKFDFIISRNDVKRGKPYPDIYVFALQKMNVNTSGCIVFEDTIYGVESAKRAGLTCIAIPNEFTKNQDFSEADKIFKNLKEGLFWVRDRYTL